MLSLVIPIFNEEKLVDELVKRTISSLESFIQEYEVIFVDDGSTDQSLDKILSWQKKTEILKFFHCQRILAIRRHILLDWNMLKVTLLQ